MSNMEHTSYQREKQERKTMKSGEEIERGRRETMHFFRLSTIRLWSSPNREWVMVVMNTYTITYLCILNWNPPLDADMNYQFSHTSLIPNGTSNERDLTIHRFPISRINIPTSSHMNEKLSLSRQTSFTQLNQGTLISKTSIQTFNFILTEKKQTNHI